MLNTGRTLVQLEVVIEEGLSKYVEIGRALGEIHLRHLWRTEKYKTWNAYLHQRWHMSVSLGTRMISCAAMVTANMDLLQGRQLPKFSHAMEIRKLAVPLRREAIKHLRFETETATTIKDYVADLAMGREDALIPKQESRMIKQLNVLKALGHGGTASIPLAENATFDGYQRRLNRALAAHAPTRKYKWATAQNKQAGTIEVTKVELRAPAEIYLRDRKDAIYKQTSRVIPPEVEEQEAVQDIPVNMCRRCGMVGMHSGYPECITALRDKIARLEVQLSSALRINAPAAPMAPQSVFRKSLRTLKSANG